MKNGWMGKMLRAALVFTCAAALVGLCGCSASKDDGKKVKDLEFAVVGEPEIPHMETDGKKGFALLSVKLYFYLLKYAALQLGEAGVQAVREGLNQFADAMGDLLVKRAAEDGLAVDRAYVRDNLPVDLDTPVDAPLWETYGDYNAREEMQKEFCDRLAAKVGI